MAKFWSKDVRFYFDGYDPGTATTRLVVGMVSEALDPTAFGDVAERSTSGRRQDTIEWAGIFDDAAAGLHVAAGTLLGTGTGEVLTIMVGTGTGSVAFAGTGHLLAATPAADLGNGLVRHSAVFAVDQAWDAGKVAADKLIGTGAGTVVSGSLDNGATTTAGASVYVHVFGGTGTVVLQDSGSASLFVTVTGLSVVVTAAPFGTKLSIASGTALQAFTRAAVINGTGTASVAFARL